MWGGNAGGLRRLELTGRNPSCRILDSGLASAYEMHYLDLRSGIHLGLGPRGLFYDHAIQLHGYAIGLNSQRVQQVQHSPAAPDGRGFSVDGDFDTGGFG